MMVEKVELLRICGGNVAEAQRAYDWLAEKGERTEAAQPKPENRTPMWEVRCVELTQEGSTCPGYFPHAAVRFSKEEAERTADQWRSRDNRRCVEVRAVLHLTP